MRIALSLLLLLVKVHAFAQVDSILSLPEQDRLSSVYEFFARLPGGPEQQLATMEALTKEFGSKKQTSLAQLAWSLRWELRNELQTDRSFESVTALFNTMIEDAKSKNWPAVVAESYFRLGLLYFDNRKFGEGMEMMMKNHAYLTDHGWSSPYTRTSILHDLGHVFYQFGEWNSAIHYLLEATRTGIAESKRGYAYKGLNTIGLSYMHLQKPDSAIYYFQRSHDVAAMQSDSFWMTLTLGNIGDVYYKIGDFENALPYLENDYRESIKYQQYGNAVINAARLANIELKNGQREAANEYLRFARQHLDTSSMEAMSTYFESTYEFYKRGHDAVLALAHADSMWTFHHRREAMLDRHILDQAEMKLAIARYDTNIRALEAEKSRQILMRNGILIIFLLTGVAAILWIKRMQLKRKTDLEKLAYAENELQFFTQSLVEKNELLQSFREKLERQDVRTDRSIEIGEMLQATILTDQDWRHFKQLFEAVYPGYLARLKEKINDLTPAETRLLALTKLKVPTREMAEMLGISIDGIRKTRYRLRKKLDLPEEGSLEELVSMV